MVSPRLWDSSIYQGFATSTLKCPTEESFRYLCQGGAKNYHLGTRFRVPNSFHSDTLFPDTPIFRYGKMNLANFRETRIFVAPWCLWSYASSFCVITRAWDCMESFEQRNESLVSDLRHEEEDEEDEEDDEVRWYHPTKQVRVCQYRSILSIVWWGEIILIIDVFWEGSRRTGGRSKRRSAHEMDAR